MPSQMPDHAKNRATTKTVPYFSYGNGVDTARDAAQNFPHFETLEAGIRVDSTDPDKEQLRQIGLRLKAKREAAGLSQAQLADLANVPRPVIGRLEQGQRSMLFQAFHRVAKALNVTESVLIDGEE